MLRIKVMGSMIINLLDQNIIEVELYITTIDQNIISVLFRKYGNITMMVDILLRRMVG